MAWCVSQVYQPFRGRPIPSAFLDCYYGNSGLLEPACSQTVCDVYHKSCSRNHACVLQSCPDAIDEVFDTKLHIIGGVGITMGVIMVSVWLTHQIPQAARLDAVRPLANRHGWRSSPSLFAGVWDDLQHAPVLRHQEVSGGGVTPTVAPTKSLLMLHDVIPWVTWLSTANRNTACLRGII